MNVTERLDNTIQKIETDANKLQDIVQNVEYHCPDKCALVHLYMCTIYPIKPSKYMIATLTFLQDVKNMHIIPIWVDAGLFPHRLSREMKDQLQCEYRQMYVERVPEGEWMLVVDSDEVLFGSIWSIPDTLIMANNVESHKQPEFMSIWEMRSDVQFKSRPRLIKKKEGITYMTPTMKHDFIKDVCNTSHFGDTCESRDCSGARNYIEVQDPIYENSWTLDFLTFAHYKRGMGLSLVSDGLLQFDKLPMNFKRLSDIEMILEMDTEQETRYQEYDRIARD